MILLSRMSFSISHRHKFPMLASLAQGKNVMLHISILPRLLSAFAADIYFHGQISGLLAHYVT